MTKFKVLISKGLGGNHVTKTGWMNALKSADIDVYYWDIQNQAAFDVFEEFEPDLFIGTTYDLDRATYKNIKKRPKMKVCMWASDYNGLGIDLDKFPVLVARDDEVELVNKLKEETGKPDLVFCHYSTPSIKKTHYNWQPIEIFSLMNAWDAIKYDEGQATLPAEADISFVGGIWPYKRQTIYPYLFPLLHPVGRYHIKIYGNVNWGVPQYCGMAGGDQEKEIFASSQICPSISEPHSQVYGYDLIERPFKIMGNGQALCISDYVKDFRMFFDQNELVMASSPEQFKQKIDYYLQNPQEGDRIKIAGQKKILRGHSYHHRMHDLFTKLGFTNQATKIMETYMKILKRRDQLWMI